MTFQNISLPVSKILVAFYILEWALFYRLSLSTTACLTESMW